MVGWGGHGVMRGRRRRRGTRHVHRREQQPEQRGEAEQAVHAPQIDPPRGRFNSRSDVAALTAELLALARG
jgi:hypothetical protein